MKRKDVLLSLLFAGYAAVVIGFSVKQYRDYRRSFSAVVPYEHPSRQIETESFVENLPEAKNSETAISHSQEMESVQHPVVQTETPAETQFVTEALPEVLPAEIEPTFPETDTLEEPPPEEEILIVQYPLDLNTATVEELQTIPDIGFSTAQNIVDYREAIGGFLRYEQLLEVPGVGEARYTALLPYVMLSVEIPEEPDQPEEIPPVPVEETQPPEIPVINLNTATKEQLLLLPNCTEEQADAILELREAIHIFQNPLEIIMSDAIPDEAYIAWKDYLAVDDEGSTQLYLN